MAGIGSCIIVFALDAVAFSSDRENGFFFIDLIINVDAIRSGSDFENRIHNLQGIIGMNAIAVFTADPQGP